MSAQLIDDLRGEARKAKRHGAFAVAQLMNDAATALAVAATDIAHLKQGIDVADRALAFVGDHSRGGVVIAGEASGDRDSMIEIARGTRRKLQRLKLPG